jgi:hypothetical protein
MYLVNDIVNAKAALLARRSLARSWDSLTQAYICSLSFSGKVRKASESADSSDVKYGGSYQQNIRRKFVMDYNNTYYNHDCKNDPNEWWEVRENLRTSVDKSRTRLRGADRRAGNLQYNNPK